MRILIAEDDPGALLALEERLRSWRYEVISFTDGVEAGKMLLRPGAPSLAILDWMMPGVEGPEICRSVRQLPTATPPYLMLLATRSSKEDIAEALEAGADDYIIKPFDPKELRARVRVGLRVLQLQRSLAQRVVELEDALLRVEQLHGLLPICSYCKTIRADEDYWEQVETYLAKHSGVRFSHGICPECYQSFLNSLTVKSLQES